MNTPTCLWLMTSAIAMLIVLAIILLALYSRASWDHKRAKEQIKDLRFRNGLLEEALKQSRLHRQRAMVVKMDTKYKR